MAYLLDGDTIKAPNQMTVQNSTQMAQHRVLSGSVKRDYFGSNKRVWQLRYSTIKKSEFDIINAKYLAYLSTDDPLTWEVTETNYTIAETTVHVDLLERDFSVKGTDYLSDFDLILTEA